MALQSQYKTYKRGQRQANIETSFQNGMMYSDGVVTDGYVKTLVNFDFTQDGNNALKPRAALTTCEVIVPDMSFDSEDFLGDDVSIKYSKECVENGILYRQFIVGKPNVENEALLDSGTIWVITSEKNINDFEDVIVAKSFVAPDSSPAAFYGTNLSEIHSVELLPDSRTSFPVGAFLGNSFYFFNQSGEGSLQRTEFNGERYVFYQNPDSSKDGLTPKALTASEAVNYGYNMLDPNPYVFEDKVGGSEIFEMHGVLPYDSSATENLMMTPRANSRVWFKCNYDAPSYVYRIVWSWKEVSGTDDWTQFAEGTYDFSNLPEDEHHNPILPSVTADMVVPAKEIMVRCEAYYVSGAADDTHDTEVVERAMTVGFDFTLDPESTTRNSQPDVYDLTTATGMMSWKNRLVVWGLPKDPTILFISDIDEPTYFPYPNNITIFDEPIISVTELMDNLIVFTRSKIHQVSLNTDGTSWTSVVLQSNLYIDPWDKHLIQPVRNMLYFKSGNYYYMLVPKAQSQTGELTLAPITTPITEFFDHFKTNVSSVFKNCYKHLDDDNNLIIIDPTNTDNPGDGLVTYYNFIDYEYIHNMYVYRYRDIYVHFDIIYSVVNRFWKINIYESPHFLYPFRNDATQNGLLATTSVFPIYNHTSDEVISKRCIQLFMFDQTTAEDVYIPSDVLFDYVPDHEDILLGEDAIVFPAAVVEYDSENEALIINSVYVRLRDLLKEILRLVNDDTWVNGFNKFAIRDAIYDAVITLKDRIIFSNKQMLDTGYRDANLFINKRYRELQLQINNPNNVDMEFGMDFQIAGEPRNTDFIYEVSQTIDELRQDEGIVYIDATPYVPIPYEFDSERKGEISKVNQWTINPDFCDDPNRHIPNDSEHIKVSHWKVRAAISGKGMAPRLRLFTKNMFNYQLLGINWIYREMNMR